MLNPPFFFLDNICLDEKIVQITSRLWLRIYNNSYETDTKRLDVFYRKSYNSVNVCQNTTTIGLFRNVFKQFLTTPGKEGIRT